MTLQEIITKLDLTVLTQPQDFTKITPTGGYAADLLSCAMARAQRQGVWVTLQAHLNVVAVAAWLDLSAIIITEGVLPDAETIARANQEGIPLLMTGKTTFEVVGRLWEEGVR